MSSPFYFAKRLFISYLLIWSSVDVAALVPDVLLSIVENAFNFTSSSPFMKSLIFPSEIEAVPNEEIYMKITKPVARQTHCYYRLNNGKDIDVKRPHKQR